MIKEKKKYISEVFYLIGEDKKRLPLLTFIFLFSSFLDLAGIGLIAPYISIVLSPEKFQETFFFRHYSVVFGKTNLEETLLNLGVVLLNVFLFKLFLSYQVNKIILNFSYSKVDRMRAHLLNIYQNIEYQEYLKRNSSDYIFTILTLTANFAHGTLNALLRILSESIVLIAIFTFLLFVRGLELMIFISIVGVVLFLFDFLFRSKLVEYGRIGDSNTKNLVKFISESISGLKEIRVLGKEKFFNERIINSSLNISTAEIKAANIKFLPKNVLEFAIVSFVVVSVFITIKMGRDIQELAVVLGMFAVAAMRLIPSTNHITAAIGSLGKTRNAISLLCHDLKQLENIQTIYPSPNVQKKSSPFQSLSLKKTSFTYNGQQRKALDDINLEVHKGEFIGIMGPSGGGKSTLLHVLLGFLPPQEGSLSVNGKAITRENQKEWLQKIAYLPQSIFLTDDSLKSNIALGTPEHLIDEQKIYDSIAKSNLSSLLQDLPNGINTHLGENGIKISGGQKQRVAIARAFYYDREILILDEATSALDSKLEAEIVEEIRQLKGQKTIISIAHRLSTLKDCDRILKIVDGKIEKVGVFSDIVKNATHS